MSNKKFVHFRTYYDRELLRRAILQLEKENIEFNVSDRSHPGSSRAPLSGYTEVDILVPESDFERVTGLLEF